MNGIFRFSVLCAAVLAAGGWAPADTVVMQNGSSVDGKILSRTDTQIRIQVNDQEVTVPVADVASAETNDKRAAPPVDTAELDRIAAEHDRELVETTGLELEQRAGVDEMLRIFFLGAEELAQSARRGLLDLAKTDKSPYRYMKMRLPEINPDRLAPMLEVMFEMNPGDMRETLMQTAHSQSASARAASLRCLGQLKDKSVLELMKSGMADEDPDVRIAAVHGIEALGVRDATPMLLQLMKAGDPRVQNAAREALSLLWTEAGQPAPSFLKNAEWDEFWKTKAAGVPGAWSAGTVEPLVPPGTVVLYD
jgi:hypothetical protein